MRRAETLRNTLPAHSTDEPEETPMHTPHESTHAHGEAMSIPLIAHRTIYTLQEFYDLMAQTRAVKKAMAERIFAGRPGMEQGREPLENALLTLDDLPLDGADPFMERNTLALDGKAMTVDLHYEVVELLKDLFFIELNEDDFLTYLGCMHQDFLEHVERLLMALHGKQWGVFITDRDGTVNNYCGRYRSSIQSLYNAVYLTRFARNACELPVMLTSAPLAYPGVGDVCVMPDGAMVLAASKGREFLDLAGERHAYAIDGAKQSVLDAFNHAITEHLDQPGRRKLLLIGSGLQFKFGQTTIARQDVNRSIPERESLDFLDEVRAIVREIDPLGGELRIEDTGLDIEVILTFESETGELKDFDKGDSVRYLNQALPMQLEKGYVLICGDTPSDVPMLEAAMEMHPHAEEAVHAVFVTRRQDLADRVTALCPNTVVVPEPDMLVVALGMLA